MQHIVTYCVLNELGNILGELGCILAKLGCILGELGSMLGELVCMFAKLGGLATLGNMFAQTQVLFGMVESTLSGHMWGS